MSGAGDGDGKSHRFLLRFRDAGALPRSHNFHALRGSRPPPPPLSSFCSFVTPKPPPAYRGRYAARLGKHILARAARCSRCNARTDRTRMGASSTSSSGGSCSHHRRRFLLRCHRRLQHRFKGTQLGCTRCGSAWLASARLARSLARSLAKILHPRESGCCRARDASGRARSKRIARSREDTASARDETRGEGGQRIQRERERVRRETYTEREGYI